MNHATDFEIVLWLALIAALWLAFDFTVLSWLAAGKRGERERDAEAGPAQRRRPDLDFHGNIIPCHPGDHLPEIAIGSRKWCGVCGYEVRA